MLILTLALMFSIIGSSIYAIAIHNTRKRTKDTQLPFSMQGKDGFGKHNNYR
jgi:hypothetical protein